MQLTFLEAKVPLTKTYEKKLDGSYVSGPYPGATNFTSYIEDVITPRMFADALAKNANLGRCLLSNSLTRPIVNESRRKLSDKEELRQWIVLDIDGIEGITTPDEFIVNCLPAQFHDTSYVMQHSPSSGIKTGVRSHIFFLLEDAVDVTSVSAWLKYTNLNTKLLSDQITLSKNSMALSLKLDWVASNNGRIVYIAPPLCVNFNDPIQQRIECIDKKYNRLSFNFAAIGSSQMRAKYRARLDELRAQAGLKASRKAEIYVMRGDTECVDDSLVEPARITSSSPDNEYFMRCNIDGGDSFAYYYYRSNPIYLYNFKGEPAVKLKLLDPEFYLRVAKPDYEAILATQHRPFVFRDRSSDKYYAGIRKDDDIIEQPMVVGSRDKIEDFFVVKGNTAPPANIETWDVVFNPTFDKQWNDHDRQFNVWRRTEYQDNPIHQTTVPTVIERVLRSVTGSDQETYDYFMNWLAYMFQTRTKTGTAWVLHGVPGTGKGLLFNNIITPLFGVDYCAQKQITDLTDRFNGWMEKCIVVNIDEANSSDVGVEATTIVSRIKNWITEPVMSVRHMQTTAKIVDSFINFIFTTNDFGALPIQDGDRRLNVAPRQEVPLEITSEEVKSIRDELRHFAGFLVQYEVNKANVHRPMNNEAKLTLKLASESSIDTFFRALEEGNLDYFLSGEFEETKEYESLNQFRLALHRWSDHATSNIECLVHANEVRHAHIVMCRDKSMKMGSFKSMCAKRGMPAKQKIDGWGIKWIISDEAKIKRKLHMKAVKTEAQIIEEIQLQIPNP